MSYTLGAGGSSGSRSKGFRVLAAMRESLSAFAETKPLHELFDDVWYGPELDAAVQLELGDEYTQLQGAIADANDAIAALSNEASQSDRDDADQALEDAMKAYEDKVDELVAASRAAAEQEQAAEEASSEASEEVSEEVAEEVAEQASEQASEDASKDASEDASEEEAEEEESSGMSVGAIVGIIGGVAGVGILAAIMIVVCKPASGGQSASGYSSLSTNDLWDRNRFAPSY